MTFNSINIQQLYRSVSKDYMKEVAGAQSGLLGASSDAICQHMHGLSLDGAHVLSMATLAAILSGVCNAKWLEALEASVPGASARAVVTKTVADFCIAGVIANSLYLIGVPALTDLYGGASLVDTLATASSGWTVEGFRAVMLIELCTFGPYNLCAFRLVPPRLRPLSAATVSATCAVALSGVTLGFGV